MKKYLSSVVSFMLLGLTILFVFLYSSSAPKSALADNSCTASQVMCSGVCTTPFCTTDAQCVSSYGAGAVCETFAGGCANTCTYGAGGGTGTAPVVSPSTNTGADGTGSTVATPALPQGCNPSTGIYSTSTGLLCYPIGCTSFSGYSTSTGLSCSVVATSGSSGSGAGTVTHSPTGMGLFSIVDPFNGGGIPALQINNSYTFHFTLNNPSGTATDFYTWRLTGTWPHGMQIGNTGMSGNSADFFGTPDTAGPYNFTIQVVDSNNFQGTEGFSGTVLAASSASAQTYLSQASALASQYGGSVITLSYGSGSKARGVRLRENGRVGSQRGGCLMSTFAKECRSTVIPGLRYRDAPAAIEWLCRAFGFEKHAVYPNPDGSIAHAQLVLERHGDVGLGEQGDT